MRGPAAALADPWRQQALGGNLLAAARASLTRAEPPATLRLLTPPCSSRGWPGFAASLPPCRKSRAASAP